jgi:hypothetical protein
VTDLTIEQAVLEMLDHAGDDILLRIYLPTGLPTLEGLLWHEHSGCLVSHKKVEQWVLENPDVVWGHKEGEEREEAIQRSQDLLATPFLWDFFGLAGLDLHLAGDSELRLTLVRRIEPSEEEPPKPWVAYEGPPPPGLKFTYGTDANPWLITLCVLFLETLRVTGRARGATG